MPIALYKQINHYRALVIACQQNHLRFAIICAHALRNFPRAVRASDFNASALREIGFVH
jgi:hypothetical protein